MAHTKLQENYKNSERVHSTVSYRMSRIRSKDTGIEIALRHALYARGLRYRKNYRKACGSPDIAFVKVKIAIFCDSSFWHGRDLGGLKKRLRSNKEFWINKIESNIARDKRTTLTLEEAGWMVLRFWDDDIQNRLEWCANLIFREVTKRKGLLPKIRRL
ncbi:MAG: very short patch repair endonuclease [Georgfuchsia sp.]